MWPTKKEPGPAPLTNAEWDRIEECAEENWGSIWKTQEENYDLKEKKKNQLKQQKKKKKIQWQWKIAVGKLEVQEVGSPQGLLC